MLTIQPQKAYNQNNTSCFQKNTGELLPLGRPPGRVLMLSLPSLPDRLLRGNDFPYIPKSMKFYHNKQPNNNRAFFIKISILGCEKHLILK